ncbi:MAG: gliding motility-associated C-terminal domain-containing protein, partial [Elusimicrobiota bacterium]
MDNDGNWSSISNIASAWAQWDVTAPSKISDLAVVEASATSVFLRWANPGDDAAKGALNGLFRVGYSSRPMASLADFNANANVIDVATSASVGSRQEILLENLISESTLYFAVQVLDDRGNAGPLSGVVRLFLDNVPSPDAAYFSVTASTVVDNLNRLRWVTPYSPDLSSVVVLRNAGAPPDRGLLYRKRRVVTDGTLEDGSYVLIVSTVAGNREDDFDDFIAGKEFLNTTYYYLIVTGDREGNYSAGVSAKARLRDNVAPMAPGQVVSEILMPGLVSLSWRPPRLNVGGEAIVHPDQPEPYEIESYEIYYSINPGGPWDLAALSPADSLSAVFFVTGLVYFQFKAVDAFGNRSQGSMVLDSGGRTLASSEDQYSVVAMPTEMSRYLRSENNPWGQAIVIRAAQETVEQAGAVIAAVRFWAEDADTGRAIPDFVFPKPQAQIALYYPVNKQGFVASCQICPQPASASVRSDNADRELALYWNNGAGKIKIYGTVDKSNQLIIANSASLGTYSVQRLMREAGFDFDVSRVAPRIITPNSDGLNDVVIFRYDNPKDSDVTGKIFDMSGGLVAGMEQGPIDNSRQWNGRDSNGNPAGGGVYLYQLGAEGRTFTGTILVAR